LNHKAARQSGPLAIYLDEKRTRLISTPLLNT
jgi:hypothetical protein